MARSGVQIWPRNGSENLDIFPAKVVEQYRAGR